MELNYGTYKQSAIIFLDKFIRLILIILTAILLIWLIETNNVYLKQFILSLNITGIKHDAVAPMLLAAPFALLIWYWRDQNKITDINIAKNNMYLINFHKIQEWATKTDNEPLQIAAIHQLIPYLLGELGKSYQRPALEIYNSLLESWQPEATSDSQALSSPVIPSYIKSIHTIIYDNINSFKGIKLKNINLKFADLSGININNLDLEAANFYKANLENATITKSNFRFSNFEYSNLIGAKINNCNFESASLSNAQLHSLDFTVAIKKVNISKTNFNKAKFLYVKLDADTIREISKSKDINLCGIQLLGNMDLSGIDLSGVPMIQAHLVGANLKNANLARANLKNANLGGANLEGANLEGAFLINTNMGAMRDGEKLPETTK